MNNSARLYEQHVSATCG